MVFTWLGRPSQEEIELQKRYNDSIALVQQQQAEAEEVRQQLERERTPAEMLDSLPEAERDSVARALSLQRFGEMASSSVGTEEVFVLENDSVAFRFSTKGGRPVASLLKTYDDYIGEPVQLMREGDFEMDFTFVTASNRVVSTKDLFFEGEQLSPTSLRMVARSDDGHELILNYELLHKYMLRMTVESDGFHNVIARNTPFFDAHISMPIYQNEKSAKTEQRYSGIAYETSGSDVEKVSTSKNVSKEIGGTVKWVAMRDMFFSTVAYSPQGLSAVAISSEVHDGYSGVLKTMGTKFMLPIEGGMEPQQIYLYSGPNDYAILKDIDRELGEDTHFAKIVDLGGWFRFINVWIVIPIFNFLERFFSNYGLIILLLTLFIKLLLSPFTYKSFMSQAKMRVLKPQVDAIAAKYPKDEDMMKRQQETMELYRRAGVNTMGGCLPMLLQMPILIAMYQYFPTSINLRGESFLWANDLSTYDDVINWGFNIPFIGDHLSLFTLLMTVTQVVYMYMSQRDSGQQQMPGMKWMPIIMAVMLFTFLNNNAAALSYYYLLSMLISMIQTWIFRKAINEEKVLAQLEENKKKPAKKKSGFMQRLEQMQKEQEKRLREQNKTSGR